MIDSQQELEARLRRALREAASELPVPPPVWAGPSAAAPRPGRRLSARALLGRLAAATAVAAPLAIALGAVLVLGGHQRPTASTAAGERQQLLHILGVLRRPQTRADREAEKLLPVPRRNRRFAFMQRTPDLPLVRLATTTPWGQKLYFVPFKPLSAKQLTEINSTFPRLARLLGVGIHEETLGLFTSSGGPIGGASGTAASIESGREIALEGAGRQVGDGSGTTITRLMVVVPDGVAKVEFVVPRQPFLDEFGAPIYAHSLSATVSVHDNVAATQVNRDATTGPVSWTTGVAMIWYAADGRVIKRIGDLAAANRVIASPQPGPETPLSRAAERDPSTPNPVWVTPRSGGAHTDFVVHFRQLLNLSGYAFRLSGTSCPTIQIINGVGSSAGPNANNLRGRLWNGSVAEGGTWCPGTYHLSAAVQVSAPNGDLKYVARPFGTATFTVDR